jgi:hypothetical protein
MVLDFESSVLANRKKTWKCRLSAPAVAAEFSVVVPVGLFEQEWSGNSHSESAESSAVASAVGQPLPQECGGGAPPAAAESTGALKKLVGKFKDIFSDTADLPAAKHGVTHRIISDGRPVSARYRGLDATKLGAARAEFQLLEDAVPEPVGVASAYGEEGGAGDRGATTGG